MSYEQQAKEFVEKSKLLSFALIGTITEETIQEDKEMSLKIALLSLSKVAASILYEIEKNQPEDPVLELFIGTVVESLNNLNEQGSAHEEAQEIIEKLRGKK